MRIGVAPHQQHLEKHHAGGPDAEAAAKPRQDVLAHERLHLEQEKGSDKNRQRV